MRFRSARSDSAKMFALGGDPDLLDLEAQGSVTEGAEEGLSCTFKADHVPNRVVVVFQRWNSAD